MKKNFKFIMVAAAAIAMIGCAKDGGDTRTPGNETEAGKPVVASFSITHEGQKTRGTEGTEVTASAGEASLTSTLGAMVFLFDATNRLEAMAPLTVTGNTAANNSVLTTSGKHYVFVAANIPLTMVTEFEGMPVTDADTNTSGISLNDFRTKILTINNAAGLQALHTANTFFMTGDKELTFKAPTPEIPEPDENKVSMKIGRAVAKVHMTITGVTQPADGIVSAIGYRSMNNPKEMYRFRTIDGGILKSPVYSEAGVTTASRGKYFQHPLSYVTPVAGNTEAFYIPENANSAASSHNTTALLIRGKYTPTTVYNENFVVTTANPTGQFFRVYDKQKATWLAQFFTKAPGKNAIIAANGGNIAIDKAYISTIKYGVDPANTESDPEYYICEYPTGQSYWMLNLENSLKSGVSKYEVERNDYFRVALASISGCGAANDDENSDDGVLPEDPKPLTVPVNITATIEVAKWNGIDVTGNI